MTLGLFGKGHQLIRIYWFERLAKQVKDPERLQPGSFVVYTPEQRPNIVCQHCDSNSDALGEPETLEWFRGRVGIVAQVVDLRTMPNEFICKACEETAQVPAHFAEMCIVVRFKHQMIGEPSGVWAFPSELKIVGWDVWKASKMPVLSGAIDSP